MRDGEAFDAALASARVLVVDDEPGMRHFLTKILEPRVHTVTQASTPQEASAALDAAQFDLVILDNVLPGGRGVDWLAEQQRKGFFGDTIMMTAYADLETAIAALRAGVSDFVLKPFRANQILSAVSRTLDRQHLRRDNRLLRHALRAGESGVQLTGSSSALGDVRAMLDRLATLSCPVLFTGPSGVGKEVAARALHAMSDRADLPFVAVNCAAISPDRIAAELFGVVEDGDHLRPGLFLLADGGVLLLDEVAEMPEAVQASLLRVVEEMRVRPVGAERDIPLKLRFLIATNADLEQAVAEGRFRADLYHRLNVVRVEMPPLKFRAEDVVELAAHFMEHLSRELGLPALELDEETLLKLSRYAWPGNVRELRNLIERSVILGAFPPEFAGAGRVTGEGAIESLDLVTQRHILHVLDLCEGNRAEAARRLGVSRKTIDRKMISWDL